MKVIHVIRTQYNMYLLKLFCLLTYDFPFTIVGRTCCC